VAPALLLALLAALLIGDPGRIDRQKTWLRITTGALIAVRLVGDIITSNKVFANNATGLLATGGLI